MSTMKTAVMSAVVSLGCSNATAKMIATEARETSTETRFLSHAKTWLMKSGRITDPEHAASVIWNTVKEFQFKATDTSEPTEAQIWAAEFAAGVRDAKSE